jgi:acetoin utilization deacetylase AcuC-like enzyme
MARRVTPIERVDVEVPVFYSDAYVLGGYAFDTTRKARWVAESLRERPIAGIELREPRSLDEEDLVAVHDPDYVTAVRTGEPLDLAESNGFSWDPGIWPMTLASNGGAVAAALAALGGRTAGSLSSGLHHARRSSGAGFCTFNGLALAARRAIGAGARGVLILDLDAHCGGGTAELLADEPAVAAVDVAVDASDRYRERGRFTLDVVREAAAYLPTLRRRLDALEPLAFDLVLYNAGMDPFERCHVGGRAGMTRALLAEREEMVFAWCRAQHLPVAFVLAGGYSNDMFPQAELVDLHRLTIEAGARHATG